MGAQIDVDPDSVADGATHGSLHEVLPDLAYQRLAMVNVTMCGAPSSADWVLIDAGIAGSAPFIRRAARARFDGNPPAAIVLTHGHFDHVGALLQLADEWDVPVYAHELEHPFLSGRAAYHPPDPNVGGGLMSLLSPFYPRGPIDVGPRLRALPSDGTTPFLPGWRWLATPGHSPGHVSFWRVRDRTLISGDAVISTRQESAYSVTVQRPELHGPPMYFTPDWKSAERSVRSLAALEPDLLVTGHGPTLQGAGMRAALHRLADEFELIAVPARGRYVAAASSRR